MKNKRAEATSEIERKETPELSKKEKDEAELRGRIPELPVCRRREGRS